MPPLPRIFTTLHDRPGFINGARLGCRRLKFSGGRRPSGTFSLPRRHCLLRAGERALNAHRPAPPLARANNAIHAWRQTVGQDRCGRAGHAAGPLRYTQDAVCHCLPLNIISGQDSTFSSFARGGAGIFWHHSCAAGSQEGRKEEGGRQTADIARPIINGYIGERAWRHRHGGRRLPIRAEGPLRLCRGRAASPAAPLNIAVAERDASVAICY